MTEATFVRTSMSIAEPLFAHLEREAKSLRRSVGEHIVRSLLAHVRANGGGDDPAVAREALFWKLIDGVEATAREIERREGFTPDITVKVVRRCTADDAWIADYRAFVGDDVYKSGVPEKARINKEIGFCVKRTLGAETEQVDGKTVTVKVLGEIIQSYSRLRKPGA